MTIYSYFSKNFFKNVSPINIPYFSYQNIFLPCSEGAFLLLFREIPKLLLFCWEALRLGKAVLLFYYYETAAVVLVVCMSMSLRWFKAAISSKPPPLLLFSMYHQAKPWPYYSTNEGLFFCGDKVGHCPINVYCCCCDDDFCDAFSLDLQPGGISFINCIPKNKIGKTCNVG